MRAFLANYFRLVMASSSAQVMGRARFVGFTLPAGMKVSDASHELQQQDSAWTLETNLRQDLHFTLVMAPAN